MVKAPVCPEYTCHAPACSGVAFFQMIWRRHSKEPSEKPHSAPLQLTYSAFLLLVALSGVCRAQSGPEKIDVRPYAPTEGSSFEQVSVMNGSLSMNVPVWSIKQRGKLKLTFALQYDSPTFTLSTFCNETAGAGFPSGCPSPPCRTTAQQLCGGGYDDTAQDDAAILGYRSGVSFGASTDFAVIAITSAAPGGVLGPSYWSLRTPDMGTHKLGFTQSGQWRTGDATGWLYQPSSCTLTDRDGTRYVFQCANSPNLQQIGGTLPGPLLYEEDTNGNKISLSYGQDNQVASWTDTEGRVIPAPAASSVIDSRCPAGTFSSSLWQIPGVPTPVLFCTSAINLSTSFLPGQWTNDGYTEATGTIYGTSRLVLPDGDTWSFSYAGDGTGHNYGELTEIDLPTGGSIRYHWKSIGHSCGNIANQPVTERRSVTERDVSADNQTFNIWQYSVALVSTNGWSANYQTTVTDPLQNSEVHYLTNLGYCSFFDTRVDHIGGTLLLTEETDYTALPLFAYLPSALTSSGIGAVPTAKRTIWPNGSTSSSSYSYDPGFAVTDFNGNSTTAPYGVKAGEQDFDYGQSSNGSPGSLLRTITTAYWWQSDTSDPVLALNILNPVSSTTIVDDITNATQQTTYGYDENSLTGGNASSGWDAAPPNGSVRGNQTSIKRLLNTTGTNLTTSLTYTNTGMVASIKQPSNPAISPAETSTYVYSATYDGGYLTTSTDALGHATQYSYYGIDSGLLLSETDPNSQPTTYNYDQANRLSSIVGPPYPVGGSPETDYHYPSPTLIEKDMRENAATWISSQITYDGLGRQIETQLLNGCPNGNSIQTVTSYDPLDRVSYVSNPYCSTSDPSYGQTHYLYDGINRKTYLYHLPDGSDQQWTYNGNVTTFTDEVGISWQHKSDGLNRLTQVMELGSASSPLSLETDYTYDGFDNLISVNQHGLSSEIARTRSFTYDSLSRLRTATNSETGIVTYNYDPDSNLQTKMDARGVTITYGYDALNRNISRSSNAPGAIASCFLYDGSNVTNGVGRLANEWTQTGSSSCSQGPSNGTLVTQYSILAYYPTGQIATEQRCTVTGCAQGRIHAQHYQYDLASNRTSLTDGLGITSFGLAYDAAGRLTGLTSTWSDPTHPPQLFSVQNYSAAGIANWTLGNNALSLTKTYDSRTRVSSLTVLGGAQ
jgi:YD repeat-containing protein